MHGHTSSFLYLETEFDASALFTEIRHLDNSRKNVASLDKTRVASHTMRTESWLSAH